MTEELFKELSTELVETLPPYLVESYRYADYLCLRLDSEAVMDNSPLRTALKLEHVAGGLKYFHLHIEQLGNRDDLSLLAMSLIPPLKKLLCPILFRCKLEGVI